MDNKNKLKYRRQRASEGTPPALSKLLGFFCLRFFRHLLLTYLDLTHWKWNAKVSRWLDRIDNR